LNRVTTWVTSRILSQSLNTESNDRLTRHGSSYGGWTLCHCVNHFANEGTFISAGVGEDISFDVEILKISNMLAILVDPTDRAEIHVNGYLKSVDQIFTNVYLEGGVQPTQNYFSSKNVRARMQFMKKALWINNNGLELYPPIDASHVSYMLRRKMEGKVTSIKFPSIDLSTIIKNIETNNLNPNQICINFLKMDIEGSEYFVIRDLPYATFRPKQILIELDFLREKNAYLQCFRLYKLINRMQNLNYRLAHTEKLNCLFLDTREHN